MWDYYHQAQRQYEAAEADWQQRYGRQQPGFIDDQA
jgi:hypothetical protein